MFGTLLVPALATAVVKWVVTLCGHRITWRLAFLLTLVIVISVTILAAR
ncbi:hypothetical protein [Actinophytocola xanthii]|nr:hypothetical protein [Actinophytocola xanthii]